MAGAVADGDSSAFVGLRPTQEFSCKAQTRALLYSKYCSMQFGCISQNSPNLLMHRLTSEQSRLDGATFVSRRVVPATGSLVHAFQGLVYCCSGSIL